MTGAAPSRTLLFALLTGLPALTQSLRADDFHNIRGFFGERAAGLAGAYTAVSDDPSGAYYNPAGLAFAYDNYISLSAVTYAEVKKTHHSAYGPGQDIERTSRRYTPGFFGAVKSFGDTKFAFSVISPSSDNFDTAEKTALPLGQPNVGRRETDFTQDSNVVYVGPSLAKAFGEKLSLGGTLYYFVDAQRTTTVDYTEYASRAFLLEDVEDRRRTMGVLPILGLQVMPSKEFSLGFSVRRPIVSARSRRRTRIVADSTKPTTSGLLVEESTTVGTGRTVDGVIFSGAGISGGIPTPTELRIGAAYFASRAFMVAGDVVYTGGYSEEPNPFLLKTGNPSVMIQPGANPINVRPTVNFALGAELYLTDNWGVRVGLFTNQANKGLNSWGESSATAGLLSSRGECPSTGSEVCLSPARDRSEHVNTGGVAFGLSRSDATSSSSATVVYERGRGGAAVDAALPNHTLSIRGLSLVIVFSLRN